MSWLWLWVALIGVAVADDDESFTEGSVTGGKHRGELVEAEEIAVDERRAALEADVAGDLGISIDELRALPHDLEVYRGSTALSTDPAFVHDCRVGIELIYQRRYREAKKHWDGLNEKYPHQGIGHVGNVLVYQALMLENFDYRYETQYAYHVELAIEELEAAIAEGGNLAWKYFLLCGATGIDSIHTMRKGEFVAALTSGLTAIGYVSKVKALAPEFADVILGDGLYKYWRSVVALNYKLIPAGTDERALGISLMKKAEAEAVFVRPAATLALIFSYIEERQFKKALERCHSGHALYPDNVINNMVTGRVYMYMRKYHDALSKFDEILVDSPDNERVHYYMAVSLTRMRKYGDALAEIDRYLGYELSEGFRASALHRKADIYYRQKDYDTAASLYQEAVKLNGYKPSKIRLARIKKLKKEGRI